jgi:hypothetical protein
LGLKLGAEKSKAPVCDWLNEEALGELGLQVRRLELEEFISFF